MFWESPVCDSSESQNLRATFVPSLLSPPCSDLAHRALMALASSLSVDKGHSSLGEHLRTRHSVCSLPQEEAPRGNIRIRDVVIHTLGIVPIGKFKFS